MSRGLVLVLVVCSFVSCQTDPTPGLDPGLHLKYTHLVPDGSEVLVITVDGDTSRYALPAYWKGDSGALRTITRLERGTTYQLIANGAVLALETQGDTLSEHVLNYNPRQGWHLYNDSMAVYYLED